VFVGEVRGAAELREIFALAPLTPERSALFTQVLSSSDFFLRKFLVGTAVSWCFLFVLVAADAALRVARFARFPDGLVLLVAAAGSFLFHVIVGGASMAALALGVLASLLLRRAAPVSGLVVLVLVATGLAACLPYFRSVTAVKEADSLFPLGINLRSWASLVPTLLGAGLLALPFVRRSWREARGALALHLGWLGAACLYALFARLPGPNQFDKPALVVYLPLALTAGLALPGLWHGLAGRPGRRTLFVAFLVLFLLPDNALRYASYLTERPPGPLSAEETALYRWIAEATPRDAVFLDSADRVDVLLRGPRAQYWGKQAYAEQWGYSREELARRRGLRDALYAPGDFDRALLAPLGALGRPAFVVVREEDAPGAADRLAARGDLFRRVFREGGFHVFRVTADVRP
jgi:hypothetical protein